MDVLAVVPIVILLAVPLLLLLIVGIILVVGRSRPQPGRGIHPVGPGHTSGSPPGIAGAAGTWNGEILGSGVLGALGGTLGSTFGTFRVSAGTLVFDAPDAASWQLPCGQITVRKRSLFALDGADVGLQTPRGELRCNVSRERINRMSRNDLKDMRERGYADEFVQVLAANGARVSV